jgi:hypothetical protein
MLEPILCDVQGPTYADRACDGLYRRVEPEQYREENYPFSHRHFLRFAGLLIESKAFAILFILANQWRFFHFEPEMGDESLSMVLMRAIARREKALPR